MNKDAIKPCFCKEGKPPEWEREYLTKSGYAVYRSDQNGCFLPEITRPDIADIAKCVVTLRCRNCDRMAVPVTHEMNIDAQKMAEEEVIKNWNSSFPSEFAQPEENESKKFHRDLEQAVDAKDL